MIAARCTCDEPAPPDLRPSERLSRFVADLLAHGGTVRELDAKTAKRALRESWGWTSLEQTTKLLFEARES